MTGLEIGILFALLFGIGGAVGLLRRAAYRSKLKGASRKELPADRSASPEEEAPRSKKTDGDKGIVDETSSKDAPEKRGADATDVDDGKLSDGLAKTRGGFVAKMGQLFGKKEIDKDVLESLEEVLFTADIGPKTSSRLFDAIKGELSRSDLTNSKSVWDALRKETLDILSVDAPPLRFEGHQPFVLLVLGVNGVGKTTTIGKVAAKLSREGKSVLLGAGDTFRAAAVEQLEIWGERANAKVIKGKSGGDPSSVLFDAITEGSKRDVDVVIADTAGRLHTKVELMDELKKVGRVIDKAMPGAPHETWLVLDATTGQNAIQQAMLFKAAMNVTGIVLTKLDGTAKGGVVLGICDELKLPIRFIGIGEQVDDLRVFDPAAFVDALYPASLNR